MFEIGFKTQQTGSLNIGRKTTSLHTGTYVDASFHFNSEAETNEQLDIHAFIGDCCVVTCLEEEVITAELLAAIDFQGAGRVLLKTAEQMSMEFP